MRRQVSCWCSPRYLRVDARRKHRQQQLTTLLLLFSLVNIDIFFIIFTIFIDETSLRVPQETSEASRL